MIQVQTSCKHLYLSADFPYDNCSTAFIWMLGCFMHLFIWCHNRFLLWGTIWARNFAWMEEPNQMSYFCKGWQEERILICWINTWGEIWKNQNLLSKMRALLPGDRTGFWCQSALTELKAQLWKWSEQQQQKKKQDEKVFQRDNKSNPNPAAASLSKFIFRSSRRERNSSGEGWCDSTVARTAVWLPAPPWQMIFQRQLSLNWGSEQQPPHQSPLSSAHSKLLFNGNKSLWTKDPTALPRNSKSSTSVAP